MLLTSEAGMLSHFEVAFVLWIKEISDLLVVDLDERDLDGVRQRLRCSFRDALVY